MTGTTISLLAFSASSQSSHRFNSESSAILVCSTLKQKRWQLLPHRYRATERRNFPLSGSNSSRLSLVVQQELVAKDPGKAFRHLIIEKFDSTRVERMEDHGSRYSSKASVLTHQWQYLRPRRILLGQR